MALAATCSVSAMYRENPKLNKHFLKGVNATGRTLGKGAFGKVVELEMSGTRCAGKQIHDVLLGFDTAGVDYVINKFVEECSLMAEVKHPNIVQFLGICMLDGNGHPLLIMEYLDMSLDDFIQAHQENFPLSLKYRLLLDVARGLQHLHTRDPVIIHRDITARNILLNKASLQAKIADLGNALLTESKRLMLTLSKMPGTAMYMPPEASGANPKYDTSLDMFSFGHLALYVATEIFPEDVLPATYIDPTTEKIQGRSEIERRQNYLYILYSIRGIGGECGGEAHTFCEIIRCCLHNLPQKRPGALKVLNGLEDLICAQEDPYAIFQSAGKLELIDLVSKMKSNEGIQPSPSAQHLSSHTRAQQLKGGAVCVLEVCFLSEKWYKRKTVTWKRYLFKIANGQKLVCFKPYKKEAIVGEINLSQVESVNIVESDEPDRFSFKIHFTKGKTSKGTMDSSPWCLSTDTAEERTSWMEAIFPSYESTAQEKSSSQVFEDGNKENLYEQLCGDGGEYEDILAGTDSAAETQQPSSQVNTEETIYNEVHEPPTLASPATNTTALSKFDPAQIEKLVEMYESLGRLIGRNDFVSGAKPVAEVGTSDSQSQVQQKYENIYEEVPNPHDSAQPYSVPVTTTPIKPPVPMPRKKLSRAYGTLPKNITPPESQHQPGALAQISETIGAPVNKGVFNKRRFDSLRERARSITPSTLLVIEGADKDTYIQRPDWAIASTTMDSIAEEGGPLNTLRRQTLYIPRSQIQNMELVAQGEYGQVHKAEYVRGSAKTIVAVKTIRKYKSKEATEDFLREMEIMTKLVHPNVIKMYGLVQEDSPWIVVEYLPNGDLRRFLQRNNRSLKTLVKYMLDIAMGMHYISEKGLVHRDIAARNILVSSSTQERMEVCKVSDFGLLREVPKGDEIYVSKHSMPVPVRWMAPESLGDRVFSSASDVWSFGILLWEMNNPTKKPYESIATNFQCALKICQGHRLKVPENYPQIVKNIMTSCWQHEPRKRPSFLLISTLLSEEIEFQ